MVCFDFTDVALFDIVSGIQTTSRFNGLLQGFFNKYTKKCKYKNITFVLPPLKGRGIK